jgi:hypothetical protein
MNEVDQLKGGEVSVCGHLVLSFWVCGEAYGGEFRWSKAACLVVAGKQREGPGSQYPL